MINEIVYLQTKMRVAEKPTLCIVRDSLGEDWKGYVEILNGRVAIFDSYRVITQDVTSIAPGISYCGVGLLVEIFNVVRIRPAPSQN